MLVFVSKMPLFVFNLVIGIQYTPVLSVSGEYYQADNVTVTVLWAPIDNITFSAQVTPLVPILTTGSTNRQLIISYNTEYNLSVVAATPCGNFIASTMLSYGEAKLAIMPIFKHCYVTFTCNANIFCYYS
jgi:hypothetical protein